MPVLSKFESERSNDKNPPDAPSMIIGNVKEDLVVRHTHQITYQPRCYHSVTTQKKPGISQAFVIIEQAQKAYLRCFETSFVISNIETWPLPKTFLRLASALMFLLSAAS